MLDCHSDRKGYLSGLLFVITATLLTTLFFYLNSVTPHQEGWYTLYAQYILKDGMVPYRDFNLVVPPLLLYIWVIIQYIFGDNFIVFHIAGIVTKLIIVVCFYNIYSKFSSYAVASALAVVTVISLIGIINDNGMLSYNDMLLIWMALITLAVLGQVGYIQKKLQPSIKYSILLGALFTLAFLNKQTNGAINIICAVTLLVILMYKQCGLRTTIRHFLIMFFSSVLLLGILMWPIISGGALTQFINDVVFGYSAKGKSVGAIFSRIFLIVINSQFMLPTFYVSIVLLIMYMVGKKENIGYKLAYSNTSTYRLIILVSLIYFAIFICAYYSVISGFESNPTSESIFSRNRTLNKISVIGLVFSFFFWLYLFVRFFQEKNIDYSRYQILVVLMMLLSSAYANSLSYAFPNNYPFLVAFLFTLALGIVVKFNWIKNILIFYACVLMVFSALSLKFQTPSLFHGWVCGSPIKQLEYTSIPKFKGLKLPVEEKGMYENIYRLVNKYSTADDKILSFMNTPAFYEILARKPYTKYISLYYDTSPDWQPLEVAQSLKTDLPKIIVYFVFPQAAQASHEGMFRGGKASGQRVLNDYITALIKTNKYVVVDYYERMTGVDPLKVPPSKLDIYNSFVEARNVLLDNHIKQDNLREFLEDNSSNNEFFQLSDFDLMLNMETSGINREYSRYSKTLSPYKYVINGFLEPGFKLMLLVRTDVYEDVNFKTKSY